MSVRLRGRTYYWDGRHWYREVADGEDAQVTDSKVVRDLVRTVNNRGREPR